MFLLEGIGYMVLFGFIAVSGFLVGARVWLSGRDDQVSRAPQKWHSESRIQTLFIAVGVLFIWVARLPIMGYSIPLNTALRYCKRL